MDDCLFCKIVAGSLPSQKVYEDDRVVAFLDIHPVNPGHLLIAQKAHAADVLQSQSEDVSAILAAARKLTPSVLKAVGADASNLLFNAGRAAGQFVLHTHLHVIPRFANDGYKHWQRKGDPIDLPSVAEKIRKELGA